jgi:C_GCAxxG_C_C family probable redox protein
MNEIEKAVELRDEGFSCSQAVCAAFCDNFGLDKNQALKISSAFGGGMHLNQTCGAVTGAFMVLGLKYGRIKADDINAKMKTIRVANEFAEKFKSRHHSISCTELMGSDLSTKEGFEQAVKNDAFKKLCSKYVRSAAEILTEMLA